MEDQSKIVINEMRKAMVATVQVPLTRKVLEQFRSDLLRSIQTNFSPNLILNFAGLEMMDRSEFTELKSIVKMAYLMGVKSYYVGLNPNVAATLVQLDADVSGIRSALNLEDAFAAIETMESA